VVAVAFAAALAIRKLGESFRHSRRSRARRRVQRDPQSAAPRKGLFFDPHRYYLDLTRDVYRGIY
jgi:hypothetical protein